MFDRPTLNTTIFSVKMAFGVDTKRKQRLLKFILDFKKCNFATKNEYFPLNGSVVRIESLMCRSSQRITGGSANMNNKEI